MSDRGKKHRRFDHFKVQWVGDLTLVRLLDRNLMAHPTAPQLEDELLAFLKAEKPAKLLIIFDEVDFCSKEGVNAFLQAQKQVRSQDGCLVLCAMNEQVRDVFRSLNLDRGMFQIADSPADGIDCLKAEPNPA